MTRHECLQEVLPPFPGTFPAQVVLEVCPERKDYIIMGKIHSNRSGFTLVEIMIVVAIIGLLAALAVPGFVKARKQSQGRRIMNDCRQMDGAIDQWALNTGQTDGDTIDTVGASTYLKTAWNTLDLLGNSYTLSTVGTGQILISTATKSSLAGVGIDWGVY